MSNARRTMAAITASMALSLAFVVGCGLGADDEVVAEKGALLATTFSDSRALSYRDGDKLMTRLFDLEGGLALSVVTSPGGRAELQIPGEASEWLEVDPGAELRQVHELAHDIWLAQMSAELGVNYGRTCYVGSDPRLVVSCGLVCDYPAPYARYGRGPVFGYYTRAQCDAYARGCGNKTVTYYFTRYYYYTGPMTYCGWMD